MLNQLYLLKKKENDIFLIKKNLCFGSDILYKNIPLSKISSFLLLCLKYMLSAIKGTYKCNHFFHILAFFLILDNLFNSNNNLSLLQKSDFSDSNREKKVPFITLTL